MKQEKVACLIDNDARLAVEPLDPFAIQTKPHGHGDVHGLLHRTGLARAWAASGLRWVTFFQDTNALVFRALLAALGVSATHGYAMNSIAVPRKVRVCLFAGRRLLLLLGGREEEGRRCGRRRQRRGPAPPPRPSPCLPSTPCSFSSSPR